MTRYLVKFILLGFILTFSLFTSSYGQGGGQQWSKKTSRIVSKAIKASNAGKHQKAVEKYESLLKSTNLNAYETSTIYHLKGQNEYFLNSYESTFVSFQKAIEAGGLKETQIENLEKNLEDLEYLIARKGTLEIKEEYVEPARYFVINPTPQESESK